MRDRSNLRAYARVSEARGGTGRYLSL